MLHPLMVTAYKVAIRAKLYAAGYTPHDINVAIDAVDSNFIKMTALSLGADVYNSTAKAGAGTGILAQILAAITQFLGSPTGQALLQALVTALIAMLAGGA